VCKLSYGRNPYYIYDNGEELYLDGVWVADEVINAFLYSILLSNRRKELGKRLQEGKQAWLKQTKFENDILIELPKDHPEILMEKEWQEMQEDVFIRTLLNL